MTVSNVFAAIGVTLQVVARSSSDKHRALILDFALMAWITAFVLKGRL